MAAEGEQQGGVFIWWSADGRRWKVHKRPEGYWHCRIGETGKRLGE